MHASNVHKSKEKNKFQFQFWLNLIYVTNIKDIIKAIDPFTYLKSKPQLN